MKAPVLFGTLALTAVNILGCAAQTPVKQPRQLNDFQQIQSSGGIDVFLTQGSTTAVVVEAVPEAQPHIVTEVQGGTLKISWESGYSWRSLLSYKRRVNVYLTSPQFMGLTLSGGADAKGQSPITADDFKIEASGGSDVDLALTAKSLSSMASGGSDISLTGRVDRQRVEVSGGSDYNAFGLQSTTAEVHASGGSDVSVSVDDELSSSASGGSDVHYKGNPRLASSHTSGGSGARRVQ